MRIPGLSLDFQPLAGVVPAALARVDSDAWNEAARVVHESGRKLVALWGADNRDRDGTFMMFAAYAVDTGLALIALPIRAFNTLGMCTYNTRCRFACGHR